MTLCSGRFYKYAIADVLVLQDQLMSASITAVQQTEAAALVLTDSSQITALLTAVTNEQAALVVSGWRDLLPQLITKYHDGYRALDLDQPDIYMQTMFYPKFWLDATGYWLNKPNLGPGVLLFDANPAGAGSGSVLATVLVTAVLSSLCTLLVGAYWLRRAKTQQRLTHDYVSINL